jgi:hypothetical protein
MYTTQTDRERARNIIRSPDVRDPAEWSLQEGRALPHGQEIGVACRGGTLQAPRVLHRLQTRRWRHRSSVIPPGSRVEGHEHRVTCTAGHLSCVRRASTRLILFGRRLRVPPCPYLWADVYPPHDRQMYAIVFTIFLQCFLCTPHPCAVWASSSRAAAPRGSSRSPALPTVRVLHARAPVRAPAARHVPIFPRAVLHGTPLVDPTACQPPGAPDLSTTTVSAGSRPRAGVPACP